MKSPLLKLSLVAAALLTSSLAINSTVHAQNKASNAYSLEPTSVAPTALDKVPLWPYTNYRSNTPTIKSVLGFEHAERITSPEQIVTYFKALEQAHPDQIKLFDYGTSWEGRPLFYAVISSAENIAKLDIHQQNIAALADPRKTNASQANQLIKQLPGSIWIGASVHGNEISPAEATLATAWHLLASQAKETKDLLENTLVYIDPLQNPDGRARFVSRYYATVGAYHSADRISAEHNEPWPNGRTNHYLFDLNRDWYVLTQPESKGRVEAFLKTKPLYFIDSHEMGGDSTYFFAPSAEPLNPHVTKTQRESLINLGKNNGKWFDHFGFDYFTAEIFDLFYPGYGGNWPNYSGSLANTYEASSSRGHHFKTTRGDILTYAHTVQKNFVAYLASIETTSKNREQLLKNFYEYRKSGLDKGKARGATQTYILANERDAAGHRRLASVLTEQGIEVRQATQAFKACGKQYQAGAYFVDAAQPSHHLIRTTLDPEVPLEPSYEAEQIDRVNKNLRPNLYDVTAWSLPHLYNLEQDNCNQTVRVNSVVVEAERIEPGKILDGDASYGYVVRWGDLNTGRLFTEALKQGLSFRSADAKFKHQDGREFPAGSLVFSHAANGNQLTDQLSTLAKQTGAIIEPLANSWIVDGPSIGSHNFRKVIAPNVALLWDEPSSVLSAGSTRYIIEQEFNYPTTAIRPAQLRSADLSNYQVIILPASARPNAYEQALGSVGRENLRDWVRKGGVLITLGNATRFAVQGEQPLLHSQLVELEDKSEKDTLDRVPGIIARTQVIQDHWLTAGVPEQLFTNYIGTEIYKPLPIKKGRNVISFENEDKLVASGVLWEKNRPEIAQSPYVLAQPEQKGLVISFTQEPNLRAYQHGQFVLLLNAIFRSTAQTTPLR